MLLPGEPDQPSEVWREVPNSLALQILRFLPGNDRACSGRLVCKAAAALLRGPQHATVRLGEAVPTHAFGHRWAAPGSTRDLTFEQRQLLVSLTAASGSLPNLGILAAHSPYLFTAHALAAAAAASHLDVVQWLREEQGCPWGDEVMPDAARAGRMDVCRWLRAAGCPWGEWPLAAAAEAGHTALCEWMLQAGCCWHLDALAAAVRGGHVDLLRWLLARRSPAPAVATRNSRLVWWLSGAASQCELSALKRLHAELFAAPHPIVQVPISAWNARSREDILSSAIWSSTPDWRAKAAWLAGELGIPTRGDDPPQPPLSDAEERAEWLWRTMDRSVASGRAARLAATQGGAAALQWLLAAGARLDADAVQDAEGASRLPVLQALHVRGERLDAARVMRCAAHRGSLDVVAWALGALPGGREALKAKVFAAAAGSGNVELLAWRAAAHGGATPTGRPL